MTACGLRFGSCLLPEDVVGQLAAPLRIHELGRERRQLAERIARQLTHAGRRRVEHLPDLVVAAALAQDQFDDRALVSGELVEGRHLATS